MTVIINASLFEIFLLLILASQIPNVATDLSVGKRFKDL
jgi:hypothetical protein